LPFRAREDVTESRTRERDKEMKRGGKGIMFNSARSAAIYTESQEWEIQGKGKYAVLRIGRNEVLSTADLWGVKA
jgi:hypothetical protein